MNKINRAFANALPGFLMLAPSPMMVFKWAPLKIGFKIFKKAKLIHRLVSSDDLAFDIGKIIGGMIIGSILKPAKSSVEKGFWWSSLKSERSWIDPKVDMANGRMVKPMTVVYHHSSHKHLDIHLGRLSLVIRVSGKPVESELHFHNGRLTHDSKDALLDHIRYEIGQNSRVVHNLDHTLSNARLEWFNGERDGSYGSGYTRQIIAQEPIEFINVDDGVGKTLKVYAPIFDKHNMLYLHKTYGNILIFGKINPTVREFEPRLDLTIARNVDEFLKKIDPKAVTKKMDGASAYFVRDCKSTRLFSPRLSKETGFPIEYSMKFPEIFRTKGISSSGMGELILKRNGRVMSAAEIGGVLNSDSVRPINVKPIFYIYRMDRFGDEKVTNLPFFENRELQKLFIGKEKFLKMVPIVNPLFDQGEGLVGVPVGGSVLDGFKLKFHEDPNDWEVESVELKEGPRGHTAGTILFRSLESGRQFRLGPGQLADEKTVRQFMNNRDRMKSMVFKVKSFKGYEGRASKIIDIHMDKGFTF